MNSRKGAIFLFVTRSLLSDICLGKWSDSNIYEHLLVHTKDQEKNLDMSSNNTISSIFNMDEAIRAFLSEWLHDS